MAILTQPAFPLPIWRMLQVRNRIRNDGCYRQRKCRVYRRGYRNGCRSGKRDNQRHYLYGCYNHYNTLKDRSDR